MFSMIPTEEYKELITSDLEHEFLRADHHQAVEEIKELKAKLGETQEKLEGLLNFLTSGQNPRWDEEYKSYDLIDNSKIADYINQNFLKDGKLNIKGNTDND